MPGPLDFRFLLGHALQISLISFFQYLQAIIVTAATLLYATGVYRIRCRVGHERVVTRSQTLAFTVAAILFVVTLSQPVDDIADASFSAHP